MKNMKIAQWAFWIGAVIAVLVGVGQAAQNTLTQNAWIPVILVVLGLVIGFLNVSVKETTPFLVAVAALVLLGSGVLGTLDKLIPKLGTLLAGTVQAFTLLAGAAAVVVAVKEIYLLAKK